MKIKTHKYLEALREAEDRGYRKGWDDANRERWDSESRTCADEHHRKEMDKIRKQLMDMNERIERIMPTQDAEVGYGNPEGTVKEECNECTTEF